MNCLFSSVCYHININRWCILSSIRTITSNLEIEIHEKHRQLYSKIQQLLMDSVLRLRNSGSNKHAISAQHFASTTRTLSKILQTRSNLNSEMRDLALERLAQAVSAAMSANCVYGNKRMFFFQIAHEHQ